MLANKSLIVTDFAPLSGSDLVGKARQRMEEEQLGMLPVVDETTQKLIGQLQQKKLERTPDNTRIAELELDEAVKLYRGQHIFEAARLMLQHELRLLPVVDEEWTFLGVLGKQEVLESLSRMLNLAEFGSVITVEVSRADFTISEIVQIIETEGGKILGVTVEMPDKTDQQFEVSFKLNLKDVSRVVSALRRYDYRVVTQSESTVFGEELEDRADELLNYINM